VFYVKYLASPRYGEVLAGRPEIRLDKLENDGADAEAAPILGAAHAYQIGSARDELHPKYHAGRELLTPVDSPIGNVGKPGEPWALPALSRGLESRAEYSGKNR